MRIIIVGGGFCGTLCAKGLERALPDAEIILIDKKGYFEFSPSIHKVIFDTSYLRKITIPYKDLLRRTRLIAQRVDEIREDHILVGDEKLHFDYLIVATGIDYPIFLKDTTNVCTLKQGSEAHLMGSKILRSKHILVIGGGLIGTEIAGELVTKARHRQVTIVHTADRLLERNPPAASAYAADMLIRRGANIIFSEKVIGHKGSTFITDSGRKIEADAALWCGGIKCDPSFMKGFAARCFSERNALNVDAFLRLIGHKNIFVGGDINSVKEEKTAQNAERHSHLIVKNILASIKGKKLEQHPPRSYPLVISLGDWRGILSTPSFVWGGIIPAMMKKLIEVAVLFRYRYFWF